MVGGRHRGGEHPTRAGGDGGGGRRRASDQGSAGRCRAGPRRLAGAIPHRVARDHGTTRRRDSPPSRWEGTHGGRSTRREVGPRTSTKCPTRRSHRPGRRAPAVERSQDARHALRPLRRPDSGPRLPDGRRRHQRPRRARPGDPANHRRSRPGGRPRCRRSRRSTRRPPSTRFLLSDRGRQLRRAEGPSFMEVAIAAEAEVRKAFFESVTGLDSAAWEWIDHGAYAEAVAEYDRLTRNQLRLLHGAAGAVIWLADWRRCPAGDRGAGCACTRRAPCRSGRAARRAGAAESPLC